MDNSEWEDKYRLLRKKREEAEEEYLSQKKEASNILDYLEANKNRVDNLLQNECVYTDRKLKEIYENRLNIIKSNYEYELENIYSFERQYIQLEEDFDVEERQIKKEEMKVLEEGKDNE